MKVELDTKTVAQLVELYKAQMLKTNPEYQRGVVWSQTQKKKLIDSVFRGYPLPLIYLHHIRRTVAGMQSEALEIIDGQQRITALYEYMEGGFKLFDPIEDDEKAKFPSFIKTQPCPWGGKEFHSLPAQLQMQLKDTSLSISKIESSDDNEIRDLFVRLQSGLPLNAQETRDAWPGQFTDFVLSLGGKPEIARYPGHDFFRELMGMSSRSDRGKARQAAAQIAMLFLERRQHGPDHFVDINAQALNEFYYSNIDFDRHADHPQRLIEILDRLVWLLKGGKHPKLKIHDAIHLVLLVDALWDDYVRSWEKLLPQALDSFLSSLAKAKNSKDSPTPDEFWSQYGQWTRVNSDRGDRIGHRHRFYMTKMLGYLAPLELKDRKRIFGEVEREILFFSQKKSCALCGSSLKWGDFEAHHVTQHSQGGKTVLENGALLHKECHPKSEEAVASFAEKFFSDRAT